MNLKPETFAVTVSQVNEYIKKIFSQDENLKYLMVKGEISNFKNHSRGHLYFTLKDENSRIIAAISIDEDEEVNQLSCWTPSLQPGGELARLAVHPDVQNQGTARQMLQYGMDVLKERGKKSIHFLVNRYNVKAIRSYAQFDFNVVGECEMFEQSFLCYEKEL